jgi:hypothetical protein
MNPQCSSTRRAFLKHAAAGTAAFAAPLILRSRQLGAAAPSNHLRLAAIGCGGRAQSVILRHLALEPDARVVVACDCFGERREKMARDLNERYGSRVCEPAADFREVIARSDIDGVVVSTPDHWHMPIAYVAARAGKDMYVEKPLGPALRWSLRVREVVRRKNLVFQYGTQQRGDQTQFRRACEFIRNGYIGKVKEVLCWCPDMATQFDQAQKPPYGSTAAVEPPTGFDYDCWLGPAPEKPYTIDRCTRYGGFHIYDYSLGFIAGWGAHPLDIAQWGLDTDDTSPIRYEGTGLLPLRRRLWDTLESYDVRCEYASGVRLRLMGEREATPRLERMGIRFHDHGTRFVGEKGWIQVDRQALISSDRRLQDAKVEVSENELRLTRTTSHMRNFLDCMRSRATPLAPLDAAIRSDTISHLGNAAIRLERPVRWDPVAERVIGDDEAEAMLNRPLRAKWDMFAG